MSDLMTAAAPAGRGSWLGLSRRGFLASAAAAGAAGAFPASSDAQQGPGGTPARNLKVLSAGSALYGMRPCAEVFARRTGVAVAVATDHGHNIHKAAMEGRADADLVLLPTNWIDEIVAKGLAERQTAVAIGAVRIGAAVREGAPRPDVSTMDALRRSLVASDSVLLTLAPTGDHLMRVIDRMGLTETVKGKLKRFDTATLLNKHLAENAGPGALGFGPATEIMVWRGKGVAWGGAIPDEIQIVLPYSGAMLTRTTAKDDARALLAFIATPEARKHFLDSGVE